MPDLSIERRFRSPVAGVDEAGRGPWAGPVVAAAVVLPPDLPGRLADGIDDSKRLAVRRREELFALLADCADVAIGAASVAEIERRNILGATHLAMRRAVARLARPPAMALVDGNSVPSGLSCPGRAVVRGDGLSLSIAAASVAAKVTRDGIMARLSLRYPAFGWDRNAGYGTRAHREALEAAGVTGHHRRGFAPVAKLVAAARADSCAPDRDSRDT